MKKISLNYLLRLRTALFLLVLALSKHAFGATIDFDSLADGNPVISQFAGVTFSNTTVLTAGVSLNELEFPPKSGGNVVVDDGGPITLTFALPVVSFEGFFTYASQ